MRAPCHAGYAGLLVHADAEILLFKDMSRLLLLGAPLRVIRRDDRRAFVLSA